MLVVDPSARVTLEALQQHPWFVQASGNGDAAPRIGRRVRLLPSESMTMQSGSACGSTLNLSSSSLSSSLKKLHSSVTVNLSLPDVAEGDFLSSALQHFLIDDDFPAAGTPLLESLEQQDPARRQQQQLPFTRSAGGELVRDRSRAKLELPKVTPAKTRRSSIGSSAQRRAAQSTPGMIPALPSAHARTGHG
jgi:hypothetical protein